MRTKALMLAVVMAILLSVPNASMAVKFVEPKCGQQVLKGEKLLLDADLNCTSYGGPIGVKIDGGIVDCAGHKISGPNNTSNPPVRSNPSDPGTNGVRIIGPRSRLQNCTIHGWGWGVVVDAERATITNTTTQYNTKYGAVQRTSAAIRAKWDGLITQYNGDEGFHISNQYNWSNNTCSAPKAVHKTTITDSSADNNGREGWYFLRTCNVKFGLPGHGNTASTNALYESSAGVYMKNSPSAHCFSGSGDCTLVQELKVTGNHVHIVGNSDGNKFEDITIVNGFVRFQSHSSTDADDPVGWGWPNNNQLTNVCVNNADYSNRHTGYIFTGVTNGGNLIKGGQVIMAATSDKVASAAADNPADENAHLSTGNSIGHTTAVYMSPTFTQPCLEDGANEFTVCSTKTTSPPSCYEP